MKNQNNFLTVFLDKPIGNIYDWIKLGTYSRNFVFPPKIHKDVTCFSDALKESVPEKLLVSLEAQERLEEQRKKRIKLILDNISEDKQWFYLALENHFFSEYFVITQWVRYWLNIWDRINNNYLPSTFNHYQLSDIEIKKARDYPIEELYTGNLRKSGNRLLGLCPFHQEKTPSFFIFQDNHWYCFGACSTGGDSINFAMKLFDIDFTTAIRRLNGHN